MQVPAEVIKYLEKDPLVKLLIIPSDVQEITSEDKDKVSIAVLPGWPSLIRKAYDNFPNLKWVHNLFTSCDSIFGYEPFKKSNILVTNGRGQSSVDLAEFGITTCLYHYKNIKEFEALKEKKEWKGLITRNLSGKKILIAGYGEIGSTLGKKAKYGFDMEVFAIKKRDIA